MSKLTMPAIQRPAEVVGSDVVFVLGAGVDKVLGLPLLNTLFKDLSDFIRGSGKPINEAIRSHVKHMRFDLESYSGDQAENLGPKLLGSHTHLLPLILAALGRHPDAENVNVAAIRLVMTKLSTIADVNELDETLMSQLSKLAGESNSGGDDTILDTDRISFRPKVRQAIKTLLNQVSTEIPDLTKEEREAFAEVIAILSNFEELLGSLFIGYYTKHIPNQKKYFYLAWLFWAYIRHKEDLGRGNRDKSFYRTISEVGSGGGVITFNYTDFFDAATRPKNGYFHGDCKAFIRFHTREYVANNVQIRDATTIARMVDFISGLRIDWSTDPPEVSLPAIVPPLAMKPIICTEYLERWYECGQEIKKAKTIVIVGYSFSVADEHFNDLVRKGNQYAKLIVIDPGLDAVVNRVCQTLGHDKSALRAKSVEGLECRTDSRLMFVKAKAEEIDSKKLMALLRNSEPEAPKPRK
jgi:hypothetical protein